MKQLIFLLAFLLPLLTTAQNKSNALDINLENYAYPYPVSFLELEDQQQSLKMAYMDVKPAQHNGKNILLLHGKNFNGAYWRTTIQALTKAGYRVIAPDQIGFGKSAKPQHYQYSFHQLAANTKKILDHLGIRTTAVLGHSMGGMLATRFALMYPGVTEKLILENPIGLEDYKTMIPYQTIDNWYQSELKADQTSIKNYQLKFYYDNKWKPEYDEWVYPLAGVTQNKQYPLVAWNNALTYDMIITQPVVYEFAKLQMPALLIIGTRDRTALGKALAPKEIQEQMGRYDLLGKATQAKIPGSRLVEIPNIGHLPHIEAFDRFIAPLLDFLKPAP
ncbi:alpha/beta fold hydrolase [Niabella beijingensis]|uniref:alpha/beta fold hydrolase n=1 Tax=Niabella beijingensis TaxID=2872700 RepID=UPI001CBF70D2|nr:alpha/beta hydrolase [Niabella beijingensis]